MNRLSGAQRHARIRALQSADTRAVLREWERVAARVVRLALADTDAARDELAELRPRALALAARLGLPI